MDSVVVRCGCIVEMDIQTQINDIFFTAILLHTCFMRSEQHFGWNIDYVAYSLYEEAGAGFCDRLGAKNS